MWSGVLSSSHGFGSDWPPKQHESDFEGTLSNPDNLTRWISAINAPIEFRRVGVVIQGRVWI